MDINNITYNWNFNSFEAYPQYAGQTDVVFTVHWQLHATTGSYRAASAGIVKVQYNEGQPFTPFSELTKEIVQTWVVEAISKQNEGAIDTLKANLAQQIQNQITPKSVTLSAPWNIPQTIIGIPN